MPHCINSLYTQGNDWIRNGGLYGEGIKQKKKGTHISRVHRFSIPDQLLVFQEGGIYFNTIILSDMTCT